MFGPEIFRLPVSLSVYNLFIKIKSTRQNNADNSRFPGFWRFRKYCSSDFCENGLDGTAVKNYSRTKAVLIGPDNSGRENRQFCPEICKNHKFVDERIKKRMQMTRIELWFRPSEASMLSITPRGHLSNSKIEYNFWRKICSRKGLRKTKEYFIGFPTYMKIFII